MLAATTGCSMLLTEDFRIPLPDHFLHPERHMVEVLLPSTL